MCSAAPSCPADLHHYPLHHHLSMRLLLKINITLLTSSSNLWGEGAETQKMQLDVEVSPRASVINLNQHKWMCPKSTYFLRYELFSSLNFGHITDGRTDRPKAMHMSPPCISTGVLKNTEVSSHQSWEPGIKWTVLKHSEFWVMWNISSILLMLLRSCWNLKLLYHIRSKMKMSRHSCTSRVSYSFHLTDVKLWHHNVMKTWHHASTSHDVTAHMSNTSERSQTEDARKDGNTGLMLLPPLLTQKVNTNITTARLSFFLHRSTVGCSNWQSEWNCYVNYKLYWTTGFGLATQYLDTGWTCSILSKNLVLTFHP